LHRQRMQSAPLAVPNPAQPGNKKGGERTTPIVDLPEFMRGQRTDQHARRPTRTPIFLQLFTANAGTTALFFSLRILAGFAAGAGATDDCGAGVGVATGATAGTALTTAGLTVASGFMVDDDI